jgi:hypothetical protein
MYTRNEIIAENAALPQFGEPGFSIGQSPGIVIQLRTLFDLHDMLTPKLLSGERRLCATAKCPDAIA